MIARPTSTDPSWMHETDLALATNPQLIVAGNTRDRHLVTGADGAPAALTTCETVAQVLAANGYMAINYVDPIDGWSLLPTAGFDAETGGEPDSDALALLTAAIGPANQPGLTDDLLAQVAAGPTPILPSLLAQLITAVVTSPLRTALVIDYAARFGDRATDPAVAALFATALKRLAEATPAPGTGDYPLPGPETRAVALFNTVIWIVGREQELPAWLVTAAGMRVIAIPEPALGARTRAALAVGPAFPGFGQLPDDGRRDFASRLAARSVGLTLADLEAVARIAVDRAMAPDEVEDAVRCLRVGLADNPWQDPELGRRITEGEQTLGDQVLGQPAAVRKALDILIRSTTGLTGSQSGASPTRPQGVLFFGGPTGVGKTELAKCLAELVFGTREAMVRFDMSEYSESQSEARLIGAPPGYVGYEAGGQLTDAVRAKPFSLLLFDEIEKAHPRILDKFLQILEDGRLTDGNGATVYFSECLIVFTSNLGVYRAEQGGGRVSVVEPGAPFDEVQRRIRAGIERYFVEQIARPELLNRIGENIVVFDFISPEVALGILELAVGRVARTLAQTWRVDLDLAPAAADELARRCTADLTLGGRGICNAVEALLVNPLARAVFTGRDRVDAAHTVRVDQVRDSDAGPEVSVTWLT